MGNKCVETFAILCSGKKISRRYQQEAVNKMTTKNRESCKFLAQNYYSDF